MRSPGPGKGRGFSVPGRAGAAWCRSMVDTTHALRVGSLLGTGASPTSLAATHPSVDPVVCILSTIRRCVESSRHLLRVAEHARGRDPIGPLATVRIEMGTRSFSRVRKGTCPHFYPSPHERVYGVSRQGRSGHGRRHRCLTTGSGTWWFMLSYQHESRREPGSHRSSGARRRGRRAARQGRGASSILSCPALAPPGPPGAAHPGPYVTARAGIGVRIRPVRCGLRGPSAAGLRPSSLHGRIRGVSPQPVPGRPTAG